jgi:hypothetical protein
MADSKIFNVNQYKSDTMTGTHQAEYADATDALANKGLVISFQHVPSSTSVYFKAFITTFNESYTSDWATESVYGRTDPIQLFKQTQRKITLAFKVPCATLGEGYGNLAKVQQLLQFLYPSYEDPASATTITQSPLVRIKVMNLLTKASAPAGDANTSPGELYASYSSATDARLGLLGAIGNISVNHNIENPDLGVLEKGLSVAGSQGGMVGAILPRMIEISVDFTAIHETTLGWANSTSFSNRGFPYGAPASAEKTVAPAPSAVPPPPLGGSTPAGDNTTVTGNEETDKEDTLPTSDQVKDNLSAARAQLGGQGLLGTPPEKPIHNEVQAPTGEYPPRVGEATIGQTIGGFRLDSRTLENGWMTETWYEGDQFAGQTAGHWEGPMPP